ncbi:CYTH and CHAD domain-containing protein [Ramlibacter sp.]|uniref:CYTH and CHAD domain-containing protein n=1 Tax=Ramlibacter sp. TaxID=1917967 RepID=UPI00261A3A2A|nr:CYTH and CHAD domain-containing protein [Ramlibacter sp.]MDB5956258.1 hypothetical protein [Ramlibacter sp.]
MTEFELKFQVPPERVAELEEALRDDTVASTRLRARYFDTPDQALAAAGLVLRIRQEGDSWVQTAKGPGRGGFERLEHNVPLGPAGDALPPEIARHRGHPVHDLLVTALQASAHDLQPTFETDVTRLARTISAGGASVEIALDRGEVRAGERTQQVQELELELKEGPPAALIELARSWCRNHGLWLDPQSKSALGRRLAEGNEAPPPATAQAVHAKARQLLPAIFDSALRQILANAGELAAGTGGNGHVHQLRIGLRRLRTGLRELPVGAPPAPAVVAALRELFHRLGEHRDRALLVPALLQELETAGHSIAAWQPALPDPGAAVRHPEVQDALVTLAGWAHALHDSQGRGAKELRARAAERLRALHARMVHAGRRFEQLRQEDRHLVRKRLKRQRYLAELVRPLYRGAAVDGYVRALKDLQDALGRYQDAVAGRALFEERAAQAPAAWFGAGWLAAREQQLAHACAKACRKAARKADPFWR